MNDFGSTNTRTSLELEDAIALARLRVEPDVVAQPGASAALHAQAASRLRSGEMFSFAMAVRMRARAFSVT